MTATRNEYTRVDLLCDLADRQMMIYSQDPNKDNLNRANKTLLELQKLYDPDLHQSSTDKIQALLARVRPIVSTPTGAPAEQKTPEPAALEDWRTVDGELIQDGSYSVIALPAEKQFMPPNAPFQGILAFDIDETLANSEGKILHLEKVRASLRLAKERNIMVGACTSRYFHTESDAHANSVKKVLEKIGLEHFSFVIFTNANEKGYVLKELPRKYSVEIAPTNIALVDDLEDNLWSCIRRGLYAISARDAMSGEAKHFEFIERFLKDFPAPAATNPSAQEAAAEAMMVEAAALLSVAAAAAQATNTEVEEEEALYTTRPRA